MNQRAVIEVFLFAALVASSIPTTAQGQLMVDPQNGTGNPNQNMVYGYSGYGTGNYGLGYGVGTGGYGLGYGLPPSGLSTDAAGMKNLVRTEGEGKQQTTQSLIDTNKKARKRLLDNQQHAISERQTAKRQTQSIDAKHREAKPAVEERAEKSVDPNQPRPLSHSQLDSTTGKIHWPAALTSKDFESLRISLECSFRARSKTTHRTAMLSSQIERQTGELKDALRGHVLEVPSSDYAEARHFLDSMAVSGN